MSTCATTLWLLVAAGLGAASEGSVLAQLERIDRSLATAEGEVSSLSKQRAELEAHLAQLSSELAVAKVRGNRAQRRFQRRLRALARMPSGVRAGLIGGAGSLAEFLSTSRMLRRIAAHDRQLHASHAQRAGELQQLAAAQAERRLRLTALSEEARAKRDALASTRSERIAFLDGLRRDRGRAAQVAREKAVAVDDLSEVVRRLQPMGRARRRFASNRGRLPWPAAGEIAVGYGQRAELAFGTVTAHNGIDLKATAGSPVQAVGGGKVVYADWLRGYGKLVIIDHGDQYHSLAAHLATVDVAVGAQIHQGQRVGTVGDTGSLRGTVLYFELRHRGLPIDPSSWLRAS